MSEDEAKPDQPRRTTLIGRVREYFVIPPSEAEILGMFDGAAGALRPEYQTVARAFRHNLMAALSTVTMPFTFAAASAEQSHFQRFHMAERIRSGMDPKEPDPELEQAAYEKARTRMQEFVASAEGNNAIVSGTCGFLLGSFEHGLESAAQELVQQGLVLVWSAFEVFCRDTFEAFLNLNPAKAKLLMDDATARKRFDAQKLPWETLFQHGFDLSTRLGSVLVGQQDFSDLPTIKLVFTTLFKGDAEIVRTLAEKDLWLLYQRRNLIVHRRGVVDRTYLDLTGETLSVGSRLAVNPDAFETALAVVIASGTATAQALAEGN